MKKSAKRFNPPAHSSPRRICPHCAAFARIRTSEALSPLTRVTKIQCSNVDCGFSWAEASEALYTISPSACPNPHIHLPPRRKDLA